MEDYDVIVLGGGASGLMCALTAGQRGKRVLVLDSSNKIGKKILMSGGGRCNFTNYTIEAENYICDNPHFVKSALSQYTQWDFIALVQQYGIAYHERDHGQLFCDQSAKDILKMLEAECAKGKVKILVRAQCEKISFNQSFYLNTSIGKFKSDALVVATGGLSIPTLGSSAYGYEVAQQFGHSLNPVRAGLVPFTFSDWFKKVTEKLSGTALRVSISTARKSFTENILFTHRGLSGPAVLQISNYWMPGETISINLMPDDNVTELLINYKQQKPKSLLKNLLAAHLPLSLVLELEKQFWKQAADKPVAEISQAELGRIADVISNLELKPSGTEGYRTAEVTLGGICTDDVSSKTMQSNIQSGLYLVGEVLDVTGHLGGYNFQWAWSSGFVAGMNV